MIVDYMRRKMDLCLLGYFWMWKFVKVGCFNSASQNGNSSRISPHLSHTKNEEVSVKSFFVRIQVWEQNAIVNVIYIAKQ